MIATSQPTPLDQWRQRLGGRHRRAQPRPLATLSYLTNGPVIDGLIAGRKSHRGAALRRVDPSAAVCFATCGILWQPRAWGVRFGGRANCRFAKDLMLQPVPGGEGYRLDWQTKNCWPWACNSTVNSAAPSAGARMAATAQALGGLPSDDAAGICGDGPELAAYVARVGKTPACLLERLRREHQDLTLHPLAWVSHHWQQAAAIFADLRQFPKRQVFCLQQRDSLNGFHGAAEFDFGRTDVMRRRPRQNTPALAV